MRTILIAASLIWLGCLLTTIIQLVMVARWTKMSVRMLFVRDQALSVIAETIQDRAKKNSHLKRGSLMKALQFSWALWSSLSALVSLVTLFLGGYIIHPLTEMYRKRTGRYLLESKEEWLARVILERFSGQLTSSGEGTDRERAAQLFILYLEILYGRLDNPITIKALYLEPTESSEMIPDDARGVLQRLCSGQITTEDAKGELRQIIDGYKTLFEKAGLGHPVQVTALHLPDTGMSAQ